MQEVCALRICSKVLDYYFKMCLRSVFVLLMLTHIRNAKSQESVHYLQSAMSDLENRMNTVHAKRRVDSLQLKSPEPALHQKDAGAENVPMLSLTKSELAALYEAVLSKEHSTTSNPNDHNTPYVHTALHDLDEESTLIHGEKIREHVHSSHASADDDGNGYYYYYYPIDSFMDGYYPTHNHIKPETHHDEEIGTHHGDEYEKLHPQYHSHTHQHSVHITSTKNAPAPEKKKIMEPLFMAVSSFIGMAVMFILSIVFLPKFGALKSRGVKQTPAGEISSLAQIILKAIEGDDCSERVVCELGKAAKALNVYNNRFVKLFRRMSPAYIGWYVDGITKYATTNLTCAAIQCKRKNGLKSKLVRIGKF